MQRKYLLFCSTVFYYTGMHYLGGIKLRLSMQGVFLSIMEFSNVSLSKHIFRKF